MDPLTQGLLGGVAAQTLSRKKNFALATGAGLVAGMLPDLDLLIRSESDPLMSLMFHRHFTHALIFIPLGGLLAALLYWLVKRRKANFIAVLWAATVGYATHGLLDAATSYGTLLLWPFSHKRIAWDTLPIVSPLFSLFLLLGFIGTLRLKRRWPAVLALVLCGFYTLGGWYQHHRVEEVQRRLALLRGHRLERARALPTVGNILLWRSVYESHGKIYADAIRLIPGRPTLIWEGGGIPLFSFSDSKIPPGSVMSKDLQRYTWFADGYLGIFSSNPYFVGDLRFAYLPDSLEPLWGIELIPGRPWNHVTQRYFRLRSLKDLGRFWEMLQGRREGTRILKKN